MAKLEIKVRGRVASFSQGSGFIVCDNSDYTVAFDFDEEWSVHDKKTARFKWNGAYKDVEFTGTECPVPRIQNARQVFVGVYAGDLQTTTKAFIPCHGSILSGEIKAQPDVVIEHRDEAVIAAERAEAAAERAEAAVGGIDTLLPILEAINEGGIA